MGLSQQEIEAVIKLAPMERYKYFIKRIADAQIMYTLVDKEGDVALSDIDDEILFPLWSAPEFAKPCIAGEWIDCSIGEISLENFEDNIIPFISENNFLLNVFGVEAKSGFVVTLDEFIRDLNVELEKYS